MKYEDYNTYVSSYLNMQSSFFLDVELDRGVICYLWTDERAKHFGNSFKLNIHYNNGSASITDNLGVDSDGNVDPKKV